MPRKDLLILVGVVPDVSIYALRLVLGQRIGSRVTGGRLGGINPSVKRNAVVASEADGLSNRRRPEARTLFADGAQLRRNLGRGNRRKGGQGPLTNCTLHCTGIWYHTHMAKYEKNHSSLAYKYTHRLSVQFS